MVRVGKILSAMMQEANPSSTHLHQMIHLCFKIIIGGCNGPTIPSAFSDAFVLHASQWQPRFGFRCLTLGCPDRRVRFTRARWLLSGRPFRRILIDLIP